MFYAPTQEMPRRLEDLTTDELASAYRGVLQDLLMFETAPYDVPLPDEWFTGRASLESKAMDILMEQCSRTRWTPSRSEPPLPPLDW